MADVYIVLAQASTSGGVAGNRLPVLKSVPKATQFISEPSGTVSDIDTAQAGVDVWQITALGDDFWVVFGTGSPEAEAGAGWLIPAGQTREWEVTEDGEKVAVMNA